MQQRPHLIPFVQQDLNQPPGDFCNRSDWNHESLWNLGYSIPNGDWINDQRDVQYGHHYNTGAPYNLTYNADCIDAGASNGLAESTWDYGSSSDGGGSEGNSVSADTLC